MAELILLTEEDTFDKDFDERLTSLCNKIVAKESGIQSYTGICITYCGKHNIHNQVQAFCRKNSTGFKKVNSLTPSNFTVGKYCIEYTGNATLRSMLKRCEVTRHYPKQK